MQEKSQIKRKILQFIDNENISKSDFYRKTGITRGILDQNNGLTEENLARFLANFPQVNTDWLIRDIGEMLRDAEKNSAAVNNTSSSPLKENRQNVTSSQIPYYADVDVTAGPGELFTDGSQQPSGYISIPDFEDCDLAVPLWGDSMAPLYHSGQVVLCKEYTAWRDYLPYGEVFLVITDSLRTVKYVKKASADDKYLLVSENPHFEPFEVPKEQILRMFIVKGAIKRNMI